MLVAGHTLQYAEPIFHPIVNPTIYSRGAHPQIQDIYKHQVLWNFHFHNEDIHKWLTSSSQGLTLTE